MSIIDLLPYWFKARRDKNSTTRKYLEAIDKEIDGANKYIEKMYNNTSVKTFKEIDYEVRKFILTSSFNEMYADDFIVERTYTELEFIRAVEKNEKRYFIDDNSIVYISCCNNSKVTINNNIVNLLPHRIWNGDIIDEIGLKLDMPRLDDENNISYSNRLKSYEKCMASSSIHGITSYIGHRMSLYKNEIWTDGSNDISITVDSIANSCVFVDGVPYNALTKEGIISLKGNPRYKGITRNVTVFYGFDIKNIKDIKVTKEIAHKISMECPISWGYARWDIAKFIPEPKDDEYITFYDKFDSELEWLNGKI